MEICLPVRYTGRSSTVTYDHQSIMTLLLVTTEETRLEDLLSRKVTAGDIGAVANTVLLLGREKVGLRVGRFVSVAKHRGSAMSDEILEYRVGEQGLVFD
jgi:hypothetical protein